MSAETRSSAMSEEAFAALRAHPGFRAACEWASTQSVEEFVRLPPAYQWITKDLGRAGICITAILLHHLGGLTVQALTAHCVSNGISSPGRVSQLVRKLQEMGQFTVDDGPGIWTRRPASMGAEIGEMFRRRGLVDMRAVAKLAPEIAEAIPLLEGDDHAFVSYLLATAEITSTRRDLFSFADKKPIDFFLNREAGMLMLFELLAAQSPDRERLMQEAPISRYGLARRYGVSRAHINKMLAESGHTQAVGDRVVFSPLLSERIEQHYALIFQLNRVSANRLLRGWRFKGPDPLLSRPFSAA